MKTSLVLAGSPNEPSIVNQPGFQVTATTLLVLGILAVIGYYKIEIVATASCPW